MTTTRIALARLRLTGILPSEVVPANELVIAAAQVGRRVRRVEGTWHWGWDDVHEPDPDGPATLRVAGFAAAVFAAVLAHAWPDPATELWPGDPLPVDIVDRIARSYGRDRKIIQKFLSLLIELGLVASNDSGRLRLGHHMATVSPRTVTVLRQQHHRLADVVRDGA